ncbi:MAG: sugar phosphate isomerase/epimerase [Clostridia bacterium]|nr:sugar phosphate isomerase/epimerase [Clostridia bacterium]
MTAGIQISSFKPLMTDEDGLQEVLFRMRGMGCSCTQLQWIDRRIPARTVSELLARAGISSYGTQDRLAAVLEDEEYYLDLCALSGGRDVCVSGLGAGAYSLAQLAPIFEKLYADARLRGLTLSLHPVKTDPTALLKGLMDLLPQLRLTLDVCQLYDAGLDPAAFIRSCAGRVDAVHFKDRDAAGNLCPVGSGVIDFKSAYSACRDAGVKVIFAEQEAWTDAFSELEQGFRYVQALCTSEN